MKIQLEHDSQPYTLDLALNGKTATVTIDGKTYTVEIIRNENGTISLRFPDSSDVRFSGLSVVSSVSSDGAKRWVTVNGQTWVFTQSSSVRKSSGHGTHPANELVAPMPGQVRAVQVAEGDAVKKGQTLVIVEAMKMEIKIAAPRDGVVKALKVRQGQTVEKDQLLVELESGQ